MRVLIDITGKRFGRLKVIKRSENSGNNTRWLCKCDCGKVTRTSSSQLRSGKAKSCGCLGRERAIEVSATHGESGTKLFEIWCNMRARCNAEYRKDYERYGGRGIKVCNEWEGDFVPFRDWALSNGYKEGLEIERVDNDGDYEPSNCAWVTRKEQVRNRSNSVNLTYKGKTLPLIEWCEFYGVKYRTAYGRYKKGWSFERIFNLTYSIRGKH